MGNRRVPVPHESTSPDCDSETPHEESVAGIRQEFLLLAGSCNGALDLIAEVVRSLADASGVVIRSGDETVLYRARSKTEDSSVRLEAVSQIPPTSARASMIAVPLYGEHDTIIGSLEVSSEKEGAFEKRDLRTLRILAGFVAEAVAAKQRLKRDASVDPTLPPKTRSAA